MPPAKSKTAKIHFLTGSDEAEVKKAASALVEELAPGADAFGLEIIDGAVDTVDTATAAIRETIQALLTFPFMGGSKLVWLKNASFLADTPTGRSDSVLEGLQELCKMLEGGLGDEMTFLLSAPDADKRRAAFKSLSKIARVSIHDVPDLGFRASEEDVIAWTAERVHSKGLKMSHEAVVALAARVGVETRQLDNEIEKLELAYGNAHSFGEDEVRMLVPATRESGIFDLSDAIARRKLQLALETLAHLFKQGEQAVGILLAAIVPTVRNLLAVKELMERNDLSPPAQPHFFASVINRLPQSAVDHLPRKKDGTINAYPLGIAAMNCRYYTLQELYSAFLRCAAANQSLVSSQVADDVVLARLLIGIMKKGG